MLDWLLKCWLQYISISIYQLYVNGANCWMPWFLIHFHSATRASTDRPRCSFCRTWLSRASKATWLQPMGFPERFASGPTHLISGHAAFDMSQWRMIWKSHQECYICISAYVQKVMHHQNSHEINSQSFCSKNDCKMIDIALLSSSMPNCMSLYITFFHPGDPNLCQAA